MGIATDKWAHDHSLYLKKPNLTAFDQSCPLDHSRFTVYKQLSKDFDGQLWTQQLHNNQNQETFPPCSTTSLPLQQYLILAAELLDSSAVLIHKPYWIMVSSGKDSVQTGISGPSQIPKAKTQPHTCNLTIVLYLISNKSRITLSIKTAQQERAFRLVIWCLSEKYMVLSFFTAPRTSIWY